MNPYTFVFIGRSGCGKGTQADMLMAHLKEKYADSPVFYLETGQKFRDFIQGSAYSNTLSKKIYENGDRQPDFLAIWMWSHILVESFTGTEHLVIDGTPRSLPEAMTLADAMKFYSRKPFIVHLNVSRKWSEERLLARGRDDDKSIIEIKKRLDWFEKDVRSALEYFSTNPDCLFVEVNGEQTIEEVYKEMMNKLNIRSNELSTN